LRTVAAIIACLVVTTMFAACDKTNPDDDDKNGGGNGKIDAKIVGTWSHTFRDAFSLEVITSTYFFYKDGTFKYSTTWNSREFNGKCSTSNGKVNLTDVSWFEYLDNGGKTEPTKRSNVVLDYEFGKNANGDYLHIYALHRLDMDDTVWNLQGAYEFLKK